MTREAFLEALVQRVEAAWGDMDAPVSLLDAVAVSQIADGLTTELPAETAEPAEDEPTLF